MEGGKAFLEYRRTRRKTETDARQATLKEVMGGRDGMD